MSTGSIQHKVDINSAFTKKSLRDSVINIIILYAGTFLGFLNTLLKVKVLTPNEIGVIAILLSINSILVIFINFGLPSTIIRHTYYFEGERKKKYYQTNIIINVLLFLLVTGILFLIRNSIIRMYDNDLVKYYFNLIIFFNFTQSLNVIFNTIFRAEELSSLGNFLFYLLPNFFNLIYFVFALLLRLSFIYYVVFICLEYLLQLMLFYIFYRLKILQTWKFFFPSRNEFSAYFDGKTFRYSIIMMLSALAATLTSNSDRLILGSLQNAYSTGILSVVANFSILIAMLGRGFVMIVHPQLALLFAKNDLSGIEKIYKENTNLQIYLGLCILIIIIIFGKNILKLIDERYVIGYLPLVFLCIGQIINIGTGPCGTIISLSKKYSYDLLLQILLSILTITLNFLLIRSFGINGAAIGTSAAIVIYNIAKVFIVYKMYHIVPYDKESIKIIIAAIPAVIVGIISNIFQFNSFLLLMTKIAIVAFFYLLFTFIFRINTVNYLIIIFKKTP